MKNKSLLILAFFLIISNVYSQKAIKDSIIIDYEFKAFKLDEKLQQKEYYGDYALLSEQEFLKLANSLFNERMDLLNAYEIKDKDFRFIEENRILVKKLNMLESFEGIKRYITKNIEFKVSNEYPEVFSQIELNNETLLNKIDDYKYLIFDYYIDKVLKKRDADSTLDFSLTFLRILSNDSINSEIRETLMYRHVTTYMQTADSLEKYFDTYKELSKNKKNKKAVSSIFKKMDKVSKGKKSPDFEFSDIKGNLVKLSDYRGQFVYIDVWATWCKPCIIEMEALDKLKKTFPGITYIGICKNDNKSRWENYVKDNKLDGIQLFAEDENDPFFKAFLMQGVPHFLLIDKEGKIINPKGPRPSGEKTSDILQGLK